MAAQLVVERKPDAMVSAGNTGASFCAGQYLIGWRSKKNSTGGSISDRAVTWTKGDPFALMLDVGATLHVNAYDLAAFVMGQPTLGLFLAIQHQSCITIKWERSDKGNFEVVEAHKILSQN